MGLIIVFGIGRINIAGKIGLAVKAVILAAALATAPPPANANPKYAGIVVDAKTGKTLYASSADAYRYPASLTKIMTLYIVFEELEAGRIGLNTRFNVSAYASGRPPSKIGLKPGSTIKVKDTILALVTKSANDVATVVAENIGGSEAGFARRMTRTARQLGMSKTTFKNPHGLPNSGQRTTARDMATLGRAIQERFPQYYTYFNTRSFTYKGRTYGNHNKLLGRVKGVDGIKTGYIRASGFNLVSNVNHNNRHIVAVVMGGKTGASRNAFMTKLIKQYLPKASKGRRTAPLIASRSLQPAFEAAALKNVPLPFAKPGTQIAAVEAPRAPLPQTAPEAPVVLALAAPPVKAETGISALISKTVDIPAEDVRSRLDNTFEVASLPPVPTPAPERSPQITMAKVTIVTEDSVEAQSGVLAEDGSVTENTARKKAAATAVEPAAVPAVPDTPVAQVAGADAEETTSITVATNNTPVQEPMWQIQIAATDSETGAMQMLKKASDATGSTLRSRVPYTEPVESGGQTLYRARFVGFETKTAAWDACKTLKKAKFACFAIYQ
ncbi:D-alanyl-D-alanine carboxypeptidase [Roseibium sp. RKSG952]|uniref:D-alanyl-D-alanine carboxypeptidase n=1 Tax=Roseibium sp. RKSG952 TaxID=2529384 RepID=UPI0012BBBF80|nr:D-alanyl-D-alanine carboxypeptidase [Roseibium sp. RKSG952]MTH97726.1 peptidase S11 [Roseibium sp. RKSG952]